MKGDDCIGIGIDASHVHRDSAWFYVNPRGTQSDYLPNRGGSKVEWKGDWQAMVSRDSTGWSAEMAIPFSLLNYPSGQRVMGLCFIRKHARTGQEWICPNLGPASDDKLADDWIGLDPPPPLLGRVILHYTNFGLGGVGLKNGLDARQQLSQQMNILLTLNPDFDSIEQDVESIDFTYAPRTLSDRRPFFSEGLELLADQQMIFYTRDIQEVDAGAKIIARGPRRSFEGLMTADGENQNAFWKAVRHLGSRSYMGLASANARWKNITSDAGCAFWDLRKTTMDREDSFNGRIFKSYTRGAGGDGTAIKLGLDGGGPRKQIGYRLNYTDVHPDYLPALGKVDYPDEKGWEWGIQYGDQNETRKIQEWYVELFGQRLNFHSGSLLRSERGASYGGTTRTAWWQVGMSRGKWSDEGVIYDDRTSILAFGWGRDNVHKQGSLHLALGRRLGGRYRFYRLSQGFGTGEQLRLRIGLEYLSMSAVEPRHSYQCVLEGNHDFTDERSMGFRLVVRHSGTNLAASYRQAVRKGMDIFILYGRPEAEQTENRLIIKLVRPIAL